MNQCEKGGAVVAPEYLPGYAEFAAYIAVDPDVHIYRRFDRIIARNLLYLQSELATLEKWFDDCDERERLRHETGSTEEQNRIARRNKNWYRFIELAKAGDDQDASEEAQREAEKMRKIRELRIVAADYRGNPSFQTAQGS